MRWNLIKIRWCDFFVINILKCIPPQTNVISLLFRGSFRAPYTTKGHAGTRQTKDLHHFKWVFPLFVLSPCGSCARAGRIYATWMSRFKGPIIRDVFDFTQSKVWGEDTAENRLVTTIQRSTKVRDKKDFVLEKSCLHWIFGLWGLKPGTALISCHDSFHKEKN